MGIDIKRIENPNNRQVTFSKRRSGIIKKAKEIAIPCEASISVDIISSSGKVFELCSGNTTMKKVLDEYQKLSQKKLWDTTHEYLNNEIEKIRKEDAALETMLRRLKSEDVSNLPLTDLMHLEEALDEGLRKVCSKRMELFKMHEEKERVLEEENEHLSNIWKKLQISMDGNVSELNNVYQCNVKECPPQMPLTSCHVLPTHPNLQDMK